MTNKTNDTSNEDRLFSLVICTYNRCELLAITLQSLAEANPLKEAWELLIVDNNSTDDTEQVVAEFQKRSPAIPARYLREANQGLSFARNRGAREANFPWVLYLDDDAKVAGSFLQRARWLTEQRTYDVVGGVYLPWYHYGKPKWYQDAYGSNKLNISTLSVIHHPNYASGGVMLWKKTLLESLGGFDVKVGMVGDKIAYGEETYLQLKAREAAIEIIYDPELIIYHVVMPQKLKVDWFFKSAFARGRDAVIGGAVGTGTRAVIWQLIIGAVVMLKDLFLATPKLFRDDYYLENWLIEVFQKFAKRLGTIYTALLWRR